ncbi:MAG: M1 family aminopeptidase [Bryobacteraceae bacterium]|nr:M1 family aminopeptidase [Bryobacteraceae bacterium]MDW8380265.1 M1 family aminopeptidase [Bryobacterales bacterium]
MRSDSQHQNQNRWFRIPVVACLLWTFASSAAFAQERSRFRFDVEHYVIDAEVNPRTQSLSAKVQMRVIPLDDRLTGMSFELHNALNVSRVTDAAGRSVPASRSQQDFTVRLSFNDPLPKGQPATLIFYYDGRLSGSEESPIYGIKFASIQNDYAYLLYPARWFPINDYQVDRFTAEVNLTVPAGYRVLGSGIPTREPAGEKITFKFVARRPSFPGSVGVVKGDPVRVVSEGATSELYFRSAAAMAQAYGEEAGKILAMQSAAFGLAPTTNLTFMETEDGAPNGYSAPGLLFLAPKSIGRQVNTRLLANQLARQWWGNWVSVATRNHIWIVNGLARYAEMMYLEQTAGPAALEAEAYDTYVEALTVDNPPLIQSARLEDYSPEYWAATAGKGASVMHMLRGVIGNDNFIKTLRSVTDQFGGAGISTDDFRRVAEQVSGQNLQAFFIQWIESTGAPEFKLSYTVFRTQKGFRINGKITQDLDTFRMPVTLRIETEGNPEEKVVEVVGTASEFVLETFGKPRKIIIDPANRVLRFNDAMRVRVAIRRGEQFAEVGEFAEALKEYQKALDVNRASSLAHYRIGEVFFLQNNYQAAANSFREALNGDLDPKWTEVWSHINLGKIFDITAQRERAVNEYNLALRTKDNTQGALEEAAKYAKEPYQRPPRSN